jgi:acetolactate synthase-1/2/3 large subunit
VTEAIAAAQAVDGPALIDFRIEREQNVFPIVPVGRPIDKMIRRPLESADCDAVREEHP